MEHYKLKNLFYGTMLLSSARQHQIADPQFTDVEDAGFIVWTIWMRLMAKMSIPMRRKELGVVLAVVDLQKTG